MTGIRFEIDLRSDEESVALCKMIDWPWPEKPRVGDLLQVHGIEAIVEVEHVVHMLLDPPSLRVVLKPKMVKDADMPDVLRVLTVNSQWERAAY